MSIPYSSLFTNTLLKPIFLDFFAFDVFSEFRLEKEKKQTWHVKPHPLEIST